MSGTDERREVIREVGRVLLDYPGIGFVEDERSPGVQWSLDRIIDMLEGRRAAPGRDDMSRYRKILDTADDGDPEDGAVL